MDEYSYEPDRAGGADAEPSPAAAWAQDAPTQTIPRITDGSGAAAYATAPVSEAVLRERAAAAAQRVGGWRPAAPDAPQNGRPGAPQDQQPGGRQAGWPQSQPPNQPPNQPPGEQPSRQQGGWPGGYDDGYDDADFAEEDPADSRAARRAASRAARMNKRRLGVVGAIGETLISLGVVLGLYVVYTLWWTNVTATAEAKTETSTIQQQFQQEIQKQIQPGAKPPAQLPTVFKPDEGFALMTIPALGKTDLPVMEGTDKEKVLDKGAVGHYTTPKSAMPWDATGNFAVAAHRRTHAEPFRYLNELKAGDHVIVETARGWFVYQLDAELPQTDPANIGTIAPIPKDGPYQTAGRYITLTTCTPEWASTYRLIWWGHLLRVDPLSGPPPAELNGR